MCTGEKDRREHHLNGDHYCQALTKRSPYLPSVVLQNEAGNKRHTGETPDDAPGPVRQYMERERQPEQVTAQEDGQRLCEGVAAVRQTTEDRKGDRKPKDADA